MKTLRSPIMRGAIEKAKADGHGCLYRWRGGYWSTVPQVEGGHAIVIPRWYVLWATVEKMIANGHLEVTERKTCAGVTIASVVTVVGEAREQEAA